MSIKNFIKLNVNFYSSTVFIIFLLLLVDNYKLCAQNLVNKETELHTTIKGTTLKIIPPKNFKVAKDFLGFYQLSTHSTIAAFEFQNNFSSQTLGFSKKHMANSEFEVYEIKRFKINNDSAVYVSSKQLWQGEYFYKEILAIGNDKKTVVINAGCIIEHVEMVKELKKSLFTSFIDDLSITPIEELIDFTLNVENTGFVLKRELSKGTNALVYVNVENESLLMAAKSITYIKDDHEKFAKESIKTIITPIETKSFKKIQIGGLDGFESLTYGYGNNKKKHNLYRIIIFTSQNYYYTFSALFRAEVSDENIQKVKSIINTFSKK